MNRRYSFAALVAVVAVSLTLGMMIGSRVPTPPDAVAAKGPERFPVVQAVDRVTPAAAIDFSAIAEAAIPAVVSVTNTSVKKASEGADPHQNLDDPIMRWFFGPEGPGSRQRQGGPQQWREVSSGSGFIVSKDGYIFTNNHVVEDATKLQVQLDSGEKYTAEVVGTDPDIDFALIKIDTKGKDLPILPIGDSDNLRVGEWVCAIGNPLELEHTVTVGVVSAKSRQVAIGQTIPGIANFIQTDAAINLGNSGGPLLNARGQVVGINTAIVRGDVRSPMVEGIGFALRINEARRAAEQLRETGTVQRGFLGIRFSPRDIDDTAADYYGLPDASGVLVDDVNRDGPAEAAGLRRGDIIRKVDGETIRSGADLLSKIAGRRPGEKVRLEVFRERKTTDLVVTLGARPKDLAAAPTTRPRGGDDSESGAKALGLEVQPLTDRMRARLQLGDDVKGVVIQSVEPGSGADEENLRSGMVISGVNDQPIAGLSDWNKAVRGIAPGSPVKIEYFDGTGTTTVFIRAAEPDAK